MLKQFIFTTIGILLSFAIAIGGWVIANRLMDIRANNLMSAAGVSPILMPLQLPQAEAAHDPEQDPQQDPAITVTRLLSEYNIVSILQNRAAPGREIPHEPTAGQLTMQEAIEIGREWLIHLEQYIDFHPDLLTFHHPPDAHLSQNIQRGGDGFLSPEYSFWTLTFSNMFMTATLLINAVEGQVWRTELALSPRVRTMSSRDFYIHQENAIRWGQRQYPLMIAPEFNVAYFEITSSNAFNMLEDFTAGLGLVTEDQYSSVGMITPIRPEEPWHRPTMHVQRFFANGRAYAAVHIAGTTIDLDLWHINTFTMYLGVQIYN